MGIERNTYKKFQQAVMLYLSVNQHIYTNNKLKIGFLISYMNDKEAVQWCKAWIERNMRVGTLWYPDFDNFLEELDEAFNPIDAVGNAMHKLQAL